METTQHAIRTDSYPAAGPGAGPTQFTERRFVYSLSWGAIIGGTIAAIGIHLLLTALAMGIGLGTWSPMTDNATAAEVGAGAAIIWSVCALIALAFGGFVAGRFSRSLHSGFVHGILVWSLTLIISLMLLSVATGKVMGGALNALGGGATAASVGLTNMTAEAAQRGSDQINSFIEEGVQALPANASPRTTTRAKREIGFALAKFFAPGNDVASRENQAAVVKSLVDNAEMTEAEATRTVNAWTTSYNNLKTELDALKKTTTQQIAQTADQASAHVSRAALWSFFSLLLGLLVTSFGGGFGARCALRNADSDRVAVNVP